MKNAISTMTGGTREDKNYGCMMMLVTIIDISDVCIFISQ